MELVEIRDDGPIRIVTIARPQVHNAMSQALMAAVAAALGDAEKAGARAFVVTGAGEKSFCSGGDLKEFDSLRTRESTLGMSMRMQRLVRALRRSPLITIAALNGDAYGGGLEFALGFDLRVAAENARFGFLQVTLGITTAWRGVSRLRELVGRSTALMLLLAGERFDAQAAFGYRIVDRVTARGGALEGALALAKQIVAHPAPAVRILKAMVDEGTNNQSANDEDASLEREAAMFAEAWLSDEHWAAVEARKRERR